MKHPGSIASIRIVLDAPLDKGGTLFWPVKKDGDLFDTQLNRDEALDFMRAGMPFQIAVADPNCKHSHYETIEFATLSRI